MKKIIFLSIFTLSLINSHAQSCKELMEYVKSNSYGTTYTSFNSDAIAKVTFYEITIDYKTQYFAIVCFKGKYSFDCREYIYQVSSSTKLNYYMNYLDSAGKAFWKFIQPYNQILECAPNFD